ncbi:MAG TPA: TonB-dependent receptor [Steroidobacteraceae bacterium]|nr:TonB-dependent receptor [Steroidobacteraceae bacterium]
MKTHHTLLSLTLLLTSAVAWAADNTAANVNAANGDDDTLQEVVVTATKQARELSKVPISITALTQDLMDQRAIKSINDIALQTPGLDLGDQGSNGVGDRISIRGIDSNSGFSTTGVYVDDTPIQGRNNPVNLGGTAFPEVFDLERVEVLRGPQGTLFGAGAEGGVVRFITPTPSLVTSSGYARGEMSYTQHGAPSYEGGAAFGIPLVEDKLGMRVSGWARHEGGWVDRTAWETGETYRNTNWSDAGGARIALRWQPGDNINITPSLLYQGVHQNDTPDYWSALSDPSAGQFRNGYQARQQSTDHLTLADLKVEVNNDNLLFTSISSYFYRNETNVSDVTNYDIAGALGAVGANGEDNIFPTVSSGALITDLFIGATQQNIFTQEFRLQNTDDHAHLRWVAGLYYQNSRLSDSQLAPNPQLPQLFLEQQGAGAFEDYYYTSDCVADCSGMLGIYEYTGVEHSRDVQTAAFGNVDWQVTPRVTLTGGLRIERTQSSFVAVEDGPVNNGASVGGGEISATPVTPKISVSFQQDNDTLYYASVAKGYRAGGGNSHVPPACGIDLDNIGLSVAPASYNSDSTISYEVGSKQHFLNGHLSANASVFYIDWRDIQWYYFLPNCGYGIVFNLGHARSQGFDLEMNAKLSPAWLASLSVGYTDAKFLDTATLPVVFSGQTLGQAPWTVFASLEYRPGNNGMYVRVTDDFKSANNGPQLFQIPDSAVYDPDLQPSPSSNQLDIRIGRNWNGLDLSLFINNALDAAPRIVNPQASHYVGYDFNSGDAISSPIFSYTTLRPRTVGFTVTYRY